MASNGGNPPTGAGTRSGKRKGAHTIQAAWEAARESNRSRERLHKQPCKGEQLKTANQTHAVSPTGPDERERTRQRPEKQRERKRGKRKTGNSAREGGRIQKLFPAWFLFGDMGGFAADLGRFGETTLPFFSMGADALPPEGPRGAAPSCLVFSPLRLRVSFRPAVGSRVLSLPGLAGGFEGEAGQLQFAN